METETVVWTKEALDEAYEAAISFEERTRIREAMQELQLEQRKVIRPYCTLIGWTDREPFEVVRKISDITVEVRAMKAEPLPWKQEWYAGGFAGHCANQNEQKWDIQPDPDAPILRIRWSKRFQQWRHKSLKFSMVDRPYKFYDYNF